MTDRNPVLGPSYTPCSVTNSGPIPCLKEVYSKILCELTTGKIDEANNAYRKTIDSLRTKLNADHSERNKAEETLVASLENLSKVCEEYITIVYAVIKVVDVNFPNQSIWKTAFCDLEKAIYSTNLTDKSTKAAMIAYYMTRSAIERINSAIQTLNVNKIVKAIKAIKSS